MSAVSQIDTTINTIDQFLNQLNNGQRVDPYAVGNVLRGAIAGIVADIPERYGSMRTAASRLSAYTAYFSGGLSGPFVPPMPLLPAFAPQMPQQFPAGVGPQGQPQQFAFRFALQQVKAQLFMLRSALVRAGLGGGLGVVIPQSPVRPQYAPYPVPAQPSGWGAVSMFLGLAGLAASIYHGYRRSGGAKLPLLGWGLAGAFFPIPTVAVAFAQGFGKPRKQ